jgi:hypothetical protein
VDEGVVATGKPSKDQWRCRVIAVCIRINAALFRSRTAKAIFAAPVAEFIRLGWATSLQYIRKKASWSIGLPIDSLPVTAG